MARLKHILTPAPSVELDLRHLLTWRLWMKCIGFCVYLKIINIHMIKCFCLFFFILINRCEVFSSTAVSESGITAVAAAHESWGWCSDTTKCQHFKHRQLFPGCLPLARCSCCFVVLFFQKQLLKEANYSCVLYSYQVHSHKFHKYGTLVLTLAKGTSFQCTQLYALARPPCYHFPMRHSLEKSYREEAIVKHNTPGLPAASGVRNHNMFLNNMIEGKCFESHGNPTQPDCVFSVAAFVGLLESCSFMVDHYR